MRVDRDEEFKGEESADCLNKHKILTCSDTQGGKCAYTADKGMYLMTERMNKNKNSWEVQMLAIVDTFPAKRNNPFSYYRHLV